MQNILSEEIEIELTKYDMTVKSIGSYIFITGIKTKKQRKYRSLNGFYNEANNINEKKNSVDSWLEMFNRSDGSLDELVENNNTELEKLNINKGGIIEAYRQTIIRKIENLEFQ